jgi:hypothetical protein
MPIRDQAAQERSLDNDYGATRGPNSPAEHEVVLFAGDPDVDGVEVPTEVAGVPTGYERVVHDNDDWEAADGGLKRTLPISFPDALTEWPDTVTHAALRDPVTGLWWDVVELEEPLDVLGPGSFPPVVLTVFYDTNLD